MLHPFGGSGTTLIAAEKTRRKARLIEIDPHYCDATVRRWEKITGRMAEDALLGCKLQDPASLSDILQ